MVSDSTAEQQNEMDQKVAAVEAIEGNADGDLEMAVCTSEEPPASEGLREEPRKWRGAVIFLCFYGFMSSIKPGEPFITPYLLSAEKNFTSQQVTNEIIPVLTYSYMAVLVPAFLLTDLLRYKPLLVLQSFSQVVIWIILLLGLVLSLCLPWPKRSLFFNQARREAASQVAAKAELDKMNPKDSQLTAAVSTCSASRWKDSIFVQMLMELSTVVKRPNMRLWSLWWVFNSTGYYLVLFYVHILWSKVYPATENNNVYNGAVEAASTLLSALTSFIAGFVKIRWNIWSELVIGSITAVQAALLLLMGTTDNIWLCYVAYVLFRSSYQFLVPIATFQIASSLTKELCALVFGINTFLGTILKSIMNLIFADKRGLALDVHSQFLVYFIYFTLLTVTYLTCAAVVIFRHFRNRPERREVSRRPKSTELSDMVPEAQPLSNGKNAKT
ncbi:reduced folate transporter isoform X2 [Phycodurus eques]|uniref:reduced folate transporter isoform X2 n=1 Tax=Phycodurus eques TaxID=693459 RepID=UPI002ACE9C21|nr:reduced folate transporter isoform X2 [Phycodurus eques]